MKVKKYLSVFALYARSSIFKILGVMLLTLIAEGFFFLRTIEKSLHMHNLGMIFDSSHIGLIFAVSFLLVTVLLCIPGCLTASMPIRSGIVDAANSINIDIPKVTPYSPATTTRTAKAT